MARRPTRTLGPVCLRPSPSAWWAIFLLPPTLHILRPSPLPSHGFGGVWGLIPPNLCLLRVIRHSCGWLYRSAVERLGADTILARWPPVVLAMLKSDELGTCRPLPRPAVRVVEASKKADKRRTSSTATNSPAPHRHTQRAVS